MRLSVGIVLEAPHNTSAAAAQLQTPGAQGIARRVETLYVWDSTRAPYPLRRWSASRAVTGARPLPSPSRRPCMHGGGYRQRHVSRWLEGKALLSTEYSMSKHMFVVEWTRCCSLINLWGVLVALLLLPCW